METQHHTMKYLVVSVALLLVGAVVGVVANPYLPAALSNSQKSYQAGFDAAKTLAEKSGIINVVQDVRALSGTVTTVNGNQLTLHVKSTNPFDDPALADRTVLLTTSTKVVKLIPKDLKVYQAEVDSYMEARAKVATTSAAKSVALPSAFTQSPASIADIGARDVINVLTAENVKTLKQFTASSIQIQSKASALPPP